MPCCLGAVGPAVNGIKELARLTKPGLGLPVDLSPLTPWELFPAGESFLPNTELARLRVGWRAQNVPSPSYPVTESVG